jgi:hypothetical protein
MCLRTAQAKRCHHHKSAKALNLSERNRYVYGYNRELLTNPNLWLADDAMITAFELLKEFASRARTRLDVLFNGTRRSVVTGGRNNIKGTLVAVLRQHHWFVCYNDARAKTWWLADSLPRPLAQMNDAAALEQLLVDNYPGSGRLVGQLETLAQQNSNDCGFFCVLNALSLLTGKTWVQDPASVRDFILCFLVSKGSSILT